MSLGQRYRLLADYNRWANGRLDEACAALDPAALAAERGAFFGSILGTLNHLLVTDRIWLRRLTGEGPSHDRLDLTLHQDAASLKADRHVETERLRVFVWTLSDDRLAQDFSYRNMAGEPFVQPLWSLLDHLFNHQTHHRGQIHALLSLAYAERVASGLDPLSPPPLDLIYFHRDCGFTRPG